MKNALVLLAQGFEEVEAVTIVDLLRRGGVEVELASLKGDLVRGAHGLALTADSVLPEDIAAVAPFDMLVLPGGMPGTRHLAEDPRVGALLRKAAQERCWIGAICAAPSVLGAAGLLQGRQATCYPGFEDACVGGQMSRAAVVVDGTIITSRGVGSAIPFGLALVRALQGEQAAQTLAAQILYEA
jgi:4-methyl-5(b-hydroxyethyl)-thiazole monophosphate biosynthesis